MTIKNIQIGQSGLSGTLPQWIYINTTDSLATVTTAGYLNGAAHEYIASLTNYMMAEVTIIPSANALPEVLLMQVSIVNGVYSLVQPYVLNNPVSGQVITVTTSSATPGTVRALTGKMVDTASVMTSGNIVGVRGEVDYVGASGGFVYGTQGKIIPTGTLSGSSWNAGLFGQLDISHATINAGQVAPIWGDYGTTSGTLTNSTGLYGLAMTNTTAAVLEGQVYLYGGATNLFLLNTNAGLSGTTYFQAAGTGVNSAGASSYAAGTEVLQINVNGTNYWIRCFTSNS